jgi:hypothetical protein
MFQQRLWLFSWTGPHALRSLVEGRPSKVAVIGDNDQVASSVSSALPSAEVRRFPQDGQVVADWADLVVYLPALV